MAEGVFQDFYPDDLALCYGCGRLNEHGLHIQSRWDGDETVALFTPQPYHIAIPGAVYGGLIASLSMPRNASRGAWFSGVIPALPLSDQASILYRIILEIG